MPFTNYDDPPVASPITDLDDVDLIHAEPGHDAFAFVHYIDWNDVRERIDGLSVGPSPTVRTGQFRPLPSPEYEIYILIIYNIYDTVSVVRAEVVCGW